MSRVILFFFQVDRFYSTQPLPTAALGSARAGCSEGLGQSGAQVVSELCLVTRCTAGLMTRWLHPELRLHPPPLPQDGGGAPSSKPHPLLSLTNREAGLRNTSPIPKL